MYEAEIEYVEKCKQTMIEAKQSMGDTHDGWFYWSCKKDHDGAKARLIERMNRDL